MKHELRQMREQGSGAIVNCSSIGGLIGLPGRAAYHATKHGVIGLTKSGISETMGVSIVPGHTALIRIPREAYSRAALFVSPITPCFVAWYAARPGRPI